MFDHSTIRREHRRAIIGALMISTFMAAIEVTVIATVMPTVVTRLGGFDLFSWAFSIYLLSQAVMTPVYGRLADLFGRKRTWMGSCVVFVLGSALCGLAWSMPSLIAFRALQGIGAGGLAPIASTIVADITPVKDRPRALGYVSSIWGVAAIIGPLAGGFLVAFGWPLVFWINVPVGLLSLGLVARFLHDDRPQHRHAIDLPGALLLLVGAGSLMLVLTQHDSLADGTILGATALGLAALAALVWQQGRAPEPLVPRHFWRHRVIVTAVAFGILTGAYIVALTAFMPMYVQGVLGGTPLEGGLLLAFAMASWTLAVLAAGRFVSRMPYRISAVCGCAALLLGAFGPLTLVPGQAGFWIRAALVLVGGGMGLGNMVFTVAVQSAVAGGDRGRATSSYFFSRILGQALGAAAFGGVLNSGLRGSHAADLAEALIDPARRLALDAATLARDSGLLEGAIHGVFRTAWILALVVLLLTLTLPARARLQERGGG